MRANNKIIAEQTLRILEEGSYFPEGKEPIDVKSRIKSSVDYTFTVAPDQFDALHVDKKEIETTIQFKNSTTIEALLEEKDSGLKTCLLNFASAKNPGGGFLGGASAQEESLARSSSLYASLVKDFTLYNYNRGRSTHLYSDYMIYSPEVLFWMNDAGDFLQQPVISDVLTAPAPNKGAMLQNECMDQLAELEHVFRTRMDKMLRLAASQKVECLILGAWGCGVFRNDPEFVAACFGELLSKNYASVFRKVIFAVYDRSKSQESFQAFQKAFGHSQQVRHEY